MLRIARLALLKALLPFCHLPFRNPVRGVQVPSEGLHTGHIRRDIGVDVYHKHFTVQVGVFQGGVNSHQTLLTLVFRLPEVLELNWSYGALSGRNSLSM